MTERSQNQAGFPVNGIYGGFGGIYVPEVLEPILNKIAEEYEKCAAEKSFREEYLTLLKDYVGRPSALTECKNLTKAGRSKDIP